MTRSAALQKVGLPDTLPFASPLVTAPPPDALEDFSPHHAQICMFSQQQPHCSLSLPIGPDHSIQKPALAPTFAYRHCSHAPLAPKIAAPSFIGRELFSMQTLVEQIVQQ
jgi:hypothetical protein